MRVIGTDLQRVFIVDDDAGVVRLSVLVKTVELHSESIATPEEFLQRKFLERTSYLVRYVRLCGTGGLNMQRTLADMGVAPNLCGHSFRRNRFHINDRSESKCVRPSQGDHPIS